MGVGAASLTNPKKLLAEKCNTNDAGHLSDESTGGKKYMYHGPI